MKVLSKFLLTLSICSLIYSCRTNAEYEKKISEEILLGNPVSVKINFLGSSWKNEISKNKSHEKGNNITNNLENGTKYKIIAYKKTGNCWDCYKFHKEENFIVGQRNPTIELNAQQNYTLLIVSLGNKTEPIVLNKIDFNSATLKINDDMNTKLMCQKINDFVPSSNTEEQIDINLERKTVGVKIILDASDILGGNLGREIKSITNAKLTYTIPKYSEFKVKDFSLNFSKEEGQKRTVNLNFANNKYVVESEIIEDLILEKTDITFSADIDVIDLSSVKKINYHLMHYKYEAKHDFTIKLAGCGAYLGANNTNWRQFMCHNLGADYSLDPFTPSANIHGDKYQWGNKNPIILQKDDKYTGSFPNWNQVAKTNTWNNEIDDPCPSGYRVPSKNEWENVTKYNTFNRIGNWNSITGKNANTGVGMGQNLLLPTAGATNQYGVANYRGGISYNSAYASYWSSNTENSGYILSITDRENFTALRALLDGMPVRCIKKLPNE